MNYPGRIALGLGAILLFLLLFGNTWDYGFNCTRCLYHEQRLKHRLCGFTYWESLGSRSDRYAAVYQTLFQRPCAHAMKSGGFGHNPGCGITAEGAVFQRRNEAVRALFEIYKRLPNATLARQSFAKIEQLFPEQTTVEQYRHPQPGETNPLDVFNLASYTEWLSVIETIEEWQEVNEAARRGFATEPEFLKNEKVLQAKLKSPSERVRNYAKYRLQSSPHPE